MHFGRGPHARGDDCFEMRDEDPLTLPEKERNSVDEKAGDVDETRLGKWIENNKASEGGTNSEREQLMRREIPLAFA